MLGGLAGGLLLVWENEWEEEPLEVDTDDVQFWGKQSRRRSIWSNKKGLRESRTCFDVPWGLPVVPWGLPPVTPPKKIPAC